MWTHGQAGLFMKTRYIYNFDMNINVIFQMISCTLYKSSWRNLPSVQYVVKDFHAKPISSDTWESTAVIDHTVVSSVTSHSLRKVTWNVMNLLYILILGWEMSNILMQQVIHSDRPYETVWVHSTFFNWDGKWVTCWWNKSFAQEGHMKCHKFTVHSYNGMENE